MSGGNVPKPIQKFKECNFPDYCMKEIEKQGYSKPTAIQAQAWPIAMSGRDLVGVAATGSGKTLAVSRPTQAVFFLIFNLGTVSGNFL